MSTKANTKAPRGVYLIASGYEWECPDCETLNREIEAKETVTCSKCGEHFVNDGLEHAYG